MQTKIRKIGNSSGILIPASTLAGLGMREGESVDLNTDAGSLVISRSAVGRIPFIRAMEEVMAEDGEALARLADL
jgi:putative addiction module antidote